MPVSAIESPQSSSRSPSIDEPDPEPAPPPTDDDHDGRVGADDRCPDQAETYEGSSDDDGCPDQPSLVRLSADGRQIELLAPVVWINAWKGEFAGDQAVLADLADLLRTLPDLRVD
ncbi:hypothetical protein ACNOYE_29130, partial [Nannocystaceae bacterium ST9]